MSTIFWYLGVSFTQRVVLYSEKIDIPEDVPLLPLFTGVGREAKLVNEVKEVQLNKMQVLLQLKEDKLLYTLLL